MGVTQSAPATRTEAETLEDNAGKLIKTYEQLQADCMYANVIGETCRGTIGCLIQFKVLNSLGVDGKLLSLVWMIGNNVLVEVSMRRFTPGFVNWPFRIPKTVTIKQFYSLYSCLVDIYKSSAPLVVSMSKSEPLLSTSGKGDDEKEGEKEIEEEEDDECKICMDGNVEVVLRCNHIFCNKCFQEWLNKNNGCAMCRQTLIETSSSDTKLISPKKKEGPLMTPRHTDAVQKLRNYLMSIGKIPVTLKPELLPSSIPPSGLRHSPMRAAANRAGTRRGSGRGSQSRTVRAASNVPWTCMICTFEGNLPVVSRCAVCGTRRHDGILHALLSDLEMMESQGRGSVSQPQPASTNQGARGSIGTDASAPASTAGLSLAAAQSLDLDLQLALLLSVSQME